MFLDTVVYEGTRFNEKIIPNYVKTVILNKRISSSTHILLLVTDWFVKGEALSHKQRLTGKVFQIKKKKIAWWSETTNTVWKKNCSQK